MNLSEKLIHSTVQILSETVDSTNFGTGFLFAFSSNEEDKMIPVIITNKHVVNGGIKGQLVFSLKDDKGDYVPQKTHSFFINNFR